MVAGLGVRFVASFVTGYDGEGGVSMRVGIGTRLTWGDESFIVIAVDYRHAVLRSLTADFTRHVEIEELIRMPEVAWQFDEPRGADASAGQVLDGLPDEERGIVDAWAEQLSRVRAEVEAGKPAKYFFEDVRVAMAPWVKVESVETVRRKFHKYCAEGILGLVDRRFLNRGKAGIDPRIGAALSELGAAGKTRSSGTVNRTVDRLRWILEEDYGDELTVPSDRTLYRLIRSHPTASKLSGSARARQIAANKPDRTFGMHGSLRPGDHVQIDSTVIDVPSQLLDGRLNRAELTIIHDVACRSIMAGVVRAISTNAADLAGVLARALTPYDMRPPGAREQRERVAATWAGQFAIDQERLDRYRLAQPYIFPEKITTDNGKIYRSAAFRRGCERAGITLIFASKETATDKPHVERTFGTMATRFVQYLEGFTGGFVERRGRDEPTDRALALNQLQELLEDWIAIEWQNRPHEGLTDPMLPGRALTPNEMFRSYRRLAPELHVPFGLNEFIGFLPAKTCTLQDYGINHANRVYNSNRITELRAAGAGGEGATRRCVFRYDPHNPLYVWVEHGDEFVPFRAARDFLDEPMGGEIWQAARDADPLVDDATRADAAHLADRMKRAQWVRRGSPRNREVRAAEVDRDPMHMTSITKSVAREEAEVEEPDDDEVMWERGGGFSLLSDDDGMWDRLT
ncbi:hypothetical protein [Microbacterium sp. A93]|uniref:hypothetical protein n=1 Tax=Microbacterium sp. A93 TaxID=3450716 RepID=UPI003F441B88